MEIIEVEGLFQSERELLSILRSFEFLRYEGYYEKEISYGGRDNPSIMYINNSLKMKVHIIGDESEFYSVSIQRKKMFTFKKEDWIFDISDYYNQFNSGMNEKINYNLKLQAEFIKKYMMSIIKGEKWIDELII
jgi:hypothetical protein